MRRQKYVPVIAMGILCGHAAAQDILTQTLTSEFAAEWSAQFTSCVKAVRLHGQGSDDLALQALGERVTPAVRTHQKIAKGLPEFWDIVVGAGTLPSPPVDCAGGLSAILDHHFAVDSGALAAADDDYSKSPFLALSDLLKIPSGGLQAVAAGAFPAAPAGFPLADRNSVAGVYRSCFTNFQDAMFAMVKSKLGR